MFEAQAQGEPVLGGSPRGWRRLVAELTEVPVVAGRLEVRDGIALGLVALWGLWLLAPGLAHPGMHDWDEVLHQAAARGTYDSFFFPHLWSDPLYPVPASQWWAGGVWLHKPIFPLWYSAVVMKVIGVTPLAMRSGALFGQLGAAFAAYLLARRAAGRFFAAAGALGFLALPFGWVLTQGLIFGDAYDCMLLGFVAATVVALVQTVERDSWRWALLAGVFLGLGHLTKTVLALAPVGIACVLVLARWLRLSKGLRPGHLLLFGGAALAVTGPWNLYAFFKWPEVYRTGAALTFGHIFADAGVDVAGWKRPVDAIFNEVNGTEFGPLPVIAPVVGAAWLLVRAAWKRETAIVVTALWVWSTWLVHSLVSVKAPGHVWNTVPAAFVGLAVLARDAFRYPALGAAGVAALLTTQVVGWFPVLGKVRGWVPEMLPQTRSVPGLAEGLALAAAAALLAWLVWRLSRRARPLGWVFGGAVAAVFLGWSLGVLPAALKAQPEARKKELLTSYTKTLGLALDRALPAKSVLFQTFERDPPGSFEVHASLFWSGRMTYRQAPDVATATQRGYRPFLVSSVAEPFAPVNEVPAHAWLRAYDLERPGPVAPPPKDMLPLDVHVDGLRVLGYATGAVDAEHDGWVFFVKPDGVPGGLRLVFHTQAGELPAVQPEPEDSLRSRHSLANVEWYVLPTLGPRRSQVKALELGFERRRVELGAKDERGS